MKRFWLACIFCLATATTLSAMEKVIDDYSVTLGIMSWKSIQAGINAEAPAFSTYQRRMAKEMAEMHGGGVVGDYHVLVVIDNKASGQQVKDAEVDVVVSSPGSSSETATLERMDMDGFAGYGGYIGFNFEKPYTMRISFKRPLSGEVRQVEFSNLP
ncbi:hypothetical protein [Geopsychrobacter electrodiphilus]|uniref:hypothetical protein n=1 Tax=Geopsychrobacter electrodiphilus TaxID=225196 RepID=UPI00037C276B|nr:hypothetical protein [Geopsychrobacter electrodiphilus]